jgi:hypothetical protein
MYKTHKGDQDMNTTTRRTPATIGATLLFTVIAAMAMLVSPSAASAQGATVSDGVITIGAIAVEQTGPCDMNGTNTHWFCDEFVVAGGDPSVPNVAILAVVNSYIDGTHFRISTVRVTLPTGCSITLAGPYLVDHAGGTSYHFSGAAGAYSLSGCSFFESILITGVLGSSPSSTTVLVAFEIS